MVAFARLRAWRFVLAWGGLAMVATAAAPHRGGDGNGAPAAKPVPANAAASNDRGLAPFGDRGLTTFGDRLSESFGTRPLESLGPIPLASMSGLLDSPIDWGKRRTPRTDREGRRLRSDRRPWIRCGRDFASAAKAPSVATLNGSLVADSEPTQQFVLPALPLPPLLLDHERAHAELATALAAEAQRAREAGDFVAAAAFVAAPGAPPPR